MIHGVALSERVLSDQYQVNRVMLARGCPLDVPVPLLYEHSGKAIGEVIHLSWIGTKLYCRAIVFHNTGGERAWQEIVEYKLRGLSCAFECGHHQTKLRDDIGVVMEFDKYWVNEISVCHKPANGDCYFAIFSGGFEGRVAGQRSLSEHRQINDRARALIARLNERYPKVENSGKRGPSEWLSAAERRRFDAWYKRSLADANLKKEKETDT